MSEGKYKSIKGTFVLETNTGGSLTFGVAGVRVPADQGKLPAYVAELVKQELEGAGSDEVERLHKRIAELEVTVDKKIAEANELKKATVAKKASL